MVGIYKIENKINHKCYIGQSASVESRWKTHIWSLNRNRHHNRHLQSAWNKYGENAFTFTILEECCDNELQDKEIYYISKYNSYNKGYNLTTGGEGSTGHTLSEDTKRHIGSFHKGKVIPEERRLLASQRFSGSGNPFYNKTHTEEIRKRISEHHILTECSKGGNNGRAKKVICAGVIYDCAGDCGDYYGIKSCTIRSWLRGDRKMPQQFVDLNLSFLEEDKYGV